jgi:hypothetical protein
MVYISIALLLLFFDVYWLYSRYSDWKESFSRKYFSDWMKLWPTMLIGGIVSGVIILCMYLILKTSIYKYGGNITTLTFSFAGAMVFLIVILEYLYSQRRVVVVFNGGLRVIIGKHEQKILWQEILSVRKMQFSQAKPLIEIILVDKTRFLLPSSDDELHRLIESKIARNNNYDHNG